MLLSSESILYWDPNNAQDPSVLWHLSLAIPYQQRDLKMAASTGHIDHFSRVMGANERGRRDTAE